MAESTAQINGEVAPGYETVRDAFERNFAEHGDVGAACAVYVQGEKVVDLRGGEAAPGVPYDAETLQLVFSTTKGAAALCAAMLVESGQLDPEARVATYWPEFAAEDKGGITVGDVLSHRAGLPAVDAELSIEQLCEVTPIVEALAAQAPLWEPGSKHGYHAVTYGWLVGEIVRRVAGVSLGAFFAREVAEPLGLDFWIGLPEEAESRVAPLIAAEPPTTAEEIELMLQIAGPGTLGFRALFMNGVLAATDGVFNTREIHATEMPAANGITNAASLARMYAAMIGEVDGVRLLDEYSVDFVRTERSRGSDASLVLESAFGFGFGLNSELFVLPGANAFGHYGAGGSVGFADPGRGLAFGYVMNQMGGGLGGDPRTAGLIDAVTAIIDGK